MYEPFRRRVLALLKVPAEPHPPTGDPASLRVFRAGRNYFRLRLAGWAFAQILALAGILFWTAVLLQAEAAIRAKKSEVLAPAGTTGATPTTRADRRVDKWANRFAENVKAVAVSEEPIGSTGKKTVRVHGWAGFKQAIVEIASVLPPAAFPLIWALKIFGFLLYLAQIPLTYAVRRLDYEMRWYMVTDRSLRLRHGVWKVSESTMSFANVQQVTVTHDPLQRLLGLGDVKVQSAGGGSREPHHGGEDMHLGLFHSVTNAQEIRDLIIERLRRFRESGLGDPDEAPVVASSDVHPGVALPASSDALTAARELLAETRALRSALS